MEAYASVLHGVCEQLLWWFIPAEFLEGWPHVGAGGTPAGPLSTPPQVSSQSSPGWLVLLLVNLCSESNTACSGCAWFLQVLLWCVDGGCWDVFVSSVGVTPLECYRYPREALGLWCGIYSACCVVFLEPLAPVLLIIPFPLGLRFRMKPQLAPALHGRWASGVRPAEPASRLCTSQQTPLWG